MSHNNRHWVLISPASIAEIDFTQVCETSAATVITNIAGDKSFVKWDGPTMPATVAAIPHLSAVLDHAEITAELAAGWFPPRPVV